jgi:hypothetical protein
VPAPAARRELRLHDAEFELRLGRDLAKAEMVFRDEIDPDGTEPALLTRAQGAWGCSLRGGGYGELASLLSPDEVEREAHPGVPTLERR